jgi:hypothetical protein
MLIASCDFVFKVESENGEEKCSTDFLFFSEKLAEALTQSKNIFVEAQKLEDSAKQTLDAAQKLRQHAQNAVVSQTSKSVKGFLHKKGEQTILFEHMYDFLKGRQVAKSQLSEVTGFSPEVAELFFIFLQKNNRIVSSTATQMTL